MNLINLYPVLNCLNTGLMGGRYWNMAHLHSFMKFYLWVEAWQNSAVIKDGG